MSQSTTSHCWVCDNRGGLYILKDVDGATTHEAKWTKVDSGFKNIYAGYDGLVCGIKNSALYIRQGVTFDCPAGTEWSKYECDVLKAIPGRLCLVRKSAKGKLFVARVHSNSAEVLDWKSVPARNCDQRTDGKNEAENVILHYVVDSGDRLFGIASSGEVFCYELLQVDSNFRWTLVAGPPPMKDSGVVGWVTSLWRTRNDKDWVRTVSPGVDLLWCLQEEGREVWQLVIGHLNGKLRTNWVKAELPLCGEEEIIAMSASKSTKDGLYLIVKEEGHYSLVRCSFNAEGSGQTNIQLPVRYCCDTLAICSTKFKVTTVNS